MFIFDRFPFRAKILIAPACTLGMFLAFGLMCWGMLKVQETRINVDLASALHVLQIVQEGERNLAESHSAIYRGLSALRTNANQEVVDRALKEQQRLSAEALVLLAERIDSTALSDGGKELHSKALSALQDYGKAARNVIGNMDVDINLADMSMQNTDQKFLALAKELNGFTEQQKAKAEETRQAIGTAQSTTLVALVVALVAAVLITLVVSVLITRSVLRQLGGDPTYAADVLQRVTDGDLTIEVVTHKADANSLLGSMKNMQDNLRRIVRQIKDSTDSISTGASDIASGNSDLSNRTEEQASSLEKTASSMNDLTSKVKQNAENARQANQLAAGASMVAIRGGEVVSQVVCTMNDISESSKKISDIIGVIDGIAFQTNILALNAAVEAARAGEQGRGFAVVATEVRNLAKRSAAAAKEIKVLIGDSVHKVEDGTRLVDEAGKTMEEIVSSVKCVTDIMAEITAASQEQSAGIEQVNMAVTQMDAVTQQNAALVEQAAAAAESMQEQAQNLTQAVSIFKLPGEPRARSVFTPLSEGAEPFEHVTNATEGSERRGPGRAKNVMRIPTKTSSKNVVRASSGAKNGTDDEWSEF